MKSFLPILILLMLLLTCSSFNDPGSLTSPGLDPPRVYGIYITGASSPEVIGIIGNPSPPNDIILLDDTLAIRIFNPYPNPFNGSTTIQYHIKETSTVDIWISKAFGANERVDNTRSLANGQLFIRGETVVDTLIQNREMIAGDYKVRWDVYSKKGRNIESGLYRVYLRSWNQLIWVDMLVLFDLCSKKDRAVLRSIGARAGSLNAGEGSCSY